MINKVAVASIVGLLALGSASCASDAFQTPLCSNLSFDSAPWSEATDPDGQLAPPGELPQAQLDSWLTASLIVALEGASLIYFSDHELGFRRLVELPSSSLFGLLKPELLLARFEVSAESQVDSVVVMYEYVDTRNQSLRGEFIEICVFMERRLSKSCDRRSVWRAEKSEDLLHGAADPFPVRSELIEQRRWATACPLIRDHDRDGYQDLILWRRWQKYEAERVIPDGEDLVWMPFDPEEQRFEVARPLAGIWPIDEACWASKGGLATQVGRADEGKTRGTE